VLSHAKQIVGMIKSTENGLSQLVFFVVKAISEKVFCRRFFLSPRMNSVLSYSFSATRQLGYDTS